MIVIQHNLDTLDRTVPPWLEVDGGEHEGDRARPADAGADRRSRAGAADRRALLQVTTCEESPHMLMIQRPTVEPLGEAEGNRQRFTISPLEPGFGHTLGNSLRRTLLSSIPGAAVTSGALRRRPPRVRRDARRQGRRHRHHPQPEGPRAALGVRRSRSCCASTSAGPADVTAADIQTTADVEILNPDLHIATRQRQGPPGPRHHRRAGPRLPLGRPEQAQPTTIGVIPVDAIFSPVRRVAFPVEPTRVEQATNYDRLTLDIETDGSISAQGGAGLGGGDAAEPRRPGGRAVVGAPGPRAG